MQIHFCDCEWKSKFLLNPMKCEWETAWCTFQIQLQQKSAFYEHFHSVALNSYMPEKSKQKNLFEVIIISFEQI